MSRFIGLVLCLVVAVHAKSKLKVQLPPESIIKLSQHMVTCVDESGVSPDIMLQIREKKQTNDEYLQKFVYCMLRNLNLGDKKGHFKFGRISDFVNMPDNEELKKVVEECNTKTGKNAMETATNVFLCNNDKLEVSYGI